MQTVCYFSLVRCGTRLGVFALWRPPLDKVLVVSIVPDVKTIRCPLWEPDWPYMDYRHVCYSASFTEFYLENRVKVLTITKKQFSWPSGNRYRSFQSGKLLFAIFVFNLCILCRPLCKALFVANVSMPDAFPGPNPSFYYMSASAF